MHIIHHRKREYSLPFMGSEHMQQSSWETPFAFLSLYSIQSLVHLISLGLVYVGLKKKKNTEEITSLILATSF